MNVHRPPTVSCSYFHLAATVRERNTGFRSGIIWSRNFTNIRQLTKRAEWWIPNEKSDASVSAKRGQKQQDSTSLLISTLFDIFDENVLRPSRKKRAAFAAALHDINPLCPICDSTVQFLKKEEKEKNNYINPFRRFLSCNFHLHNIITFYVLLHIRGIICTR